MSVTLPSMPPGRVPVTFWAFSAVLSQVGCGSPSSKEVAKAAPSALASSWPSRAALRASPAGGAGSAASGPGGGL
ncbi:hypothetical protein ACFQ0B_36800 [Nonomuraea thailandensis]